MMTSQKMKGALILKGGVLIFMRHNKYYYINPKIYFKLFAINLLKDRDMVVF
jgi:hypothetical protein